MTTVAWVVVVVLAIAVAWLGFAMVGLVREVAGLREQVLALAGGPIHLGSGLPVGSAAPAWSLDEGAVTSDALAGRRHLLLFADADCRTCDDLVPAVIAAVGRGGLPPTVVVERGGAPVPPAWRGADVLAGAEHGEDVSRAFDVSVSPHVFVVDEQGAIVGQGGAVTLADVEALVRDTQGIRIVPGAAGG